MNWWTLLKRKYLCFITTFAYTPFPKIMSFTKTNLFVPRKTIYLDNTYQVRQYCDLCFLCIFKSLSTIVRLLTIVIDSAIIRLWFNSRKLTSEIKVFWGNLQGKFVDELYGYVLCGQLWLFPVWNSYLRLQCEVCAIIVPWTTVQQIAWK